MCSLQFAKASAATLPQQENVNSLDVQRGRLNILLPQSPAFSASFLRHILTTIT
jgi:hypothetical protein